MTRYVRRLVARLRGQGATEGQIADIVREVQGLGLDDERLEAELGPPDTYAAALVPRGEAGVRLTDLLIPLGALAALAWAAVALFGSSWGWNLYDALGPLRLVPAVALGVGGFVAQRALDYWRPVRT